MRAAQGARQEHNLTLTIPVVLQALSAGPRPGKPPTHEKKKNSRKYVPSEQKIALRYNPNQPNTLISTTTRHDKTAVLRTPSPYYLPLANTPFSAHAHLQSQEHLVVYHPRQLRPDVAEHRHAPQRPQGGPQRVARPRPEADVPGRRKSGGGDGGHGGPVARGQGLVGQHAAQAANNLQREAKRDKSIFVENFQEFSAGLGTRGSVCEGGGRATKEKRARKGERDPCVEARGGGEGANDRPRVPERSLERGRKHRDQAG